MSDATEKAIDTAADVAGEVKDHAEDVERAIRALNQVKVKYFAMGVAVGAAVGAVVAFKIAYTKAETKYSQIADEEIDEMRRHYRRKTVAAEGEAAKRPLDEIVQKQGYSSSNETSEEPPMAVQPPLGVVQDQNDEADEADEDEDEDHTRVISEVERMFDEEQRQLAEWVAPEWDYHEELRKRSPDIPYVIHYDERHEMGYQDMMLTYWDKDDVLSNEREEVIDPDERDAMIGEGTLDRFGHGSLDRDIVFVRNDKLELIFEITRSPNSFAETVHGFSHDDLYHGNLERMRARERDEQDDD